MIKELKLAKVVYPWGDQVKVGDGELLFFANDGRLINLTQEDAAKFNIVGEIGYESAYLVKKGRPYPSFNWDK